MGDLMAATNGTRTELMSMLTRADQRWAQRQGDEPAAAAYLAHLEKYLRPMVGEASDRDGEASIVDAGELNELRVRLEATERELAARTAAHDQLAGELQTATAGMARLGEQLASAESELELVRDERARLVDELGETRQRRTGDEQAVANMLAEVGKHKSVAAVLRQKLRRATERLELAEEHVHRYPAPGPGLPLEPCECGQSYPRYFEFVEDEESAAAAAGVEPWADLFDRIRGEIADGDLT